MLSGGPDSVLALKLALTTTPDPVLALHVIIVDVGGRHERESLACKRVVEHCRRVYRDFEYEEAKIVPHKSAKWADVPVLGVFAAMTCLQRGDIGKTWLGVDANAADGAVDQAFRDVLRHTMFPGYFPEAQMPEAHYPRPAENVDKQTVRDRIGEDLWALTWSCRTPKFPGRPCGDCHSCKVRSATHAGA